MAEIERVTIALPEPTTASTRDVEELRRRWDAGNASRVAGEINVRDLIADEKTKKARRG